MDEIPTPRTDCHAFDLDVKGDAHVTRDKYTDGDYVQSDFARRLERELTISKQKLDFLSRKYKSLLVVLDEDLEIKNRIVNHLEGFLAQK